MRVLALNASEEKGATKLRTHQFDGLVKKKEKKLNFILNHIIALISTPSLYFFYYNFFNIF